jgi:3-oxoacyl-[acyl-carrier-protein] synthase II
VSTRFSPNSPPGCQRPNLIGSSTPPRVVITGLGAVTPLGATAPATWEKLLAGESGIDYISRFDTAELRVKIGGEVRDFNPWEHLDGIGGEEVRPRDRHIQFALQAAREAWADSQIDLAAEDPERMGVVIGSGLGACEASQEMAGAAAAQGRGNRTRGQEADQVTGQMAALVATWVESAAGVVAGAYNLQGPTHAITSACATGTSACGEAFEVLRRGDADVMVTGAAEAPLLPIVLASFDVMGALSLYDGDPKAACRPFDRDRDGFVLSEGAAVLVLESEEHARRRGAHIYAEVVGYGNAADAYHMAAPHPDGRGLAAAMRMALRKAAAYGVAPEDVGYINAHGTGTRLNDAVETTAIKQVLGEHAYDLHVSSTKSMTGHLAGAAGALEALIAAKVIAGGTIPPTINLAHADPACDLNYTPNAPVAADAGVVLSNSCGLAGHNTCIVLRRYESPQA